MLTQSRLKEDSMLTQSKLQESYNCYSYSYIIV
jgi:hypothetical protein